MNEHICIPAISCSVETQLILFCVKTDKSLLWFNIKSRTTFEILKER